MDAGVVGGQNAVQREGRWKMDESNREKIVLKMCVHPPIPLFTNLFSVGEFPYWNVVARLRVFIS